MKTYMPIPPRTEVSGTDFPIKRVDDIREFWIWKFCAQY